MRRASPTTAQQRGQDRTLEQELCARRRGRCNVFGGANDDGRIETLPLFIGSASTVRLGKPGCCVSGPTAQFNETALDIGCAEPTYQASFLGRASEFLMRKFRSDFSRELCNSGSTDTESAGAPRQDARVTPGETVQQKTLVRP